MKRDHYEEYVWHMLRHFIRKPESAKTPVDIHNLECVQAVFNQISDYDRTMIEYIFKSGQAKDNIYAMVKTRGISLTNAWMVVDKVTRAIAKERGLI